MDDQKKLTENTLPELPDPKEKLLEAPEPASVNQPAPEAAETEAAPVSDEDARKAAIDEMEKASQKALDAMRESGNEKNEEVIDEASKKLENIFDDLRKWMQENTQPERVKAEFKAVGDSVSEILEKTRQGVISVSQSEQFKKTMESGKDFLVGTGAMIADGLQYGYSKLMEIPEFRKASEFVDKQVDNLRHSEALKTFVDRSAEGISQFNTAIFDGLKSFFSPENDQTRKEDLPDLPEDNDKTGE